MAEISSTPDLRDPLGAPQIVTGTEYMKALSDLGYNVTNMTSMLPTITKIAEAGTSFMDNAIKQRQDYLKSQADLAETTARAQLTQSDADYNNRSMQLRLDDLDLKNKSAKIDLTTKEQTMQGAIAAINAENALAPEKAQNAADLSKAQAQEAQQRVAANTSAMQLLIAAQGEQGDALKEMPLPSDPDFDNKMAANIAKYHNAWGNDKTRGMLEDEWKARDQVRGRNIDAIKRAQDTKFFLDARDDGSLGGNADINGLLSNPQMGQQAKAQVNITRTLRNVQGVIDLIPKDPADLAALPAPVQRQARELNDFKEHIKGLLADREQGLASIARGEHADLFDANGNLNPSVAGDIDQMRTYYSLLQKQAGEVKPATTDVTITYMDTTGGKSEIKAVNVPIDQAETVRQRLLASGMPVTGITPATTAQQPRQATPMERRAAGAGGGIPQAMRQRMNTDPAYAHRVHEAIDHGTVSDWKKLYDELNVRQNVAGVLQNLPQGGAGGTSPGALGFQAGGSVDDVDATQTAQDITAASLLAGQQIAGQPMQGYQTGGDVDPVTTGPANTDTVPALLTPGEFVLNAPAARAIGAPTLNRMNRTGTLPSQQPLAGSPLQPMAMPALAAASQATQRVATDQTPAATTGPATQPLASTGGIGPQKANAGVNNPDINTVQQGAKITQYGYIGDATWDSNSAKGVGDRENQLAPGVSVALTQSMRKQLFPDAKVNPKTGLTSSTGRTFTWNGRTYRDDDNAPEADPRIDVYNPYYDGVDKGVTAAQLQQRQNFLNTAMEVTAGYQAGGPVYGYSPAARALGGNTPSISADLSTLPEGNPLYSPSTGRQPRQPVSAPGFQHGGPVGEGSFGGRGRSGGSGDESIFGGGTAGGGGDSGWLPQQKQKRRRFHPKLPGEQGPDIPDEMQKKLAKLSHDYLSGLSGIIQQRPEMGAQLLRHARNQLAANLGTGAEDEEEGQQQDYGAPEQQYSPAQYAMTATGNEPT